MDSSSVSKSFLAAVSMLIATGCTDVRLAEEPLYEAVGYFASDEAQISQKIGVIGRAADLPLRDTMNDHNNTPMYLLSNDDVVVTFRKYDPDFSNAMTGGVKVDLDTWIISVTARDAEAELAAQERAIYNFTSRASEAMRPVKITWRTRE